MRRAPVGVVGLLAALGAVTWFALESGGVGTVETTAADGTPRYTHVWPVEIDGVLWLEAGTPQNAWYVDIGREPDLWLDREGERRAYHAVPVPTEAARRRVRDALRARFGWRDAWVGMFVDSSGSVAVRLDPAAEPVGVGRPRSRWARARGFH